MHVVVTHMQMLVRIQPGELVLDIVRLVDVDTDGYRQEDGSIQLIYSWYCHLHPEEIGSLFMYSTEADAARAALDHITDSHGDGRSEVS